MTFNQLLQEVRKDHPNLNFKPSDHFSWSSDLSQITYQSPGDSTENHKLSNKLLHELAHAKLGHHNYISDAELLKIESTAWILAKELCEEYSVEFSESEQNESLASYISWASSRCQCPKCQKNGLQTLRTEFFCPACNNKWNVGRSRFTRTYRQNS